MIRIFSAFLVLGCTAFGGPVAHIGFFREAFVTRRAWLSPAAFADLVALCHVLPGPASSQVGLGIGYLRGGVPGALAAWAGFTLPSALLLAALAVGFSALPPDSTAAAARGLAWAAAAVVAQAVLHMAKDRVRRAADAPLLLAAAALAWVWPGVGGQIAALALGAAWGIAFAAAPQAEAAADAPPPRFAWLWLAAWAALLALLPLLAAGAGRWASLADRFYRVGSLVFGGGHVVLPLLKAEWVDAGLLPAETFLAGYGAAQAVPGPLFTLAAYLGAALAPDAPWRGAAVALVAVFLPSALLVFGILPYAARLRRSARVARALSGVNLAVVGLLAAAWVNPVCAAAVRGWPDAAAVAAGFALLLSRRVPVPLLVAVLAAVAAAFPF
ncbi:chromate efflux transporter [Oleispirillum naphthae]|uniref:chromate efflux transporter n=1 Tax=Oleispirillum naphthae TaxID=2838853 RepID=UPI003082407B